jgi:hypothetical protein
MTRQFANAVSTTLSSSMTSVQTTMTVASAMGFPSAYPFDAHIEAEGANSDEIVSVTSLSSGTTYNVARASESYGGSASASAHGSGANVRLVGPTAGALANFATLATTTYPLGSLGASAGADFANGPTQAGTLTANTAITLAWTGLAGTDDAIMELLLTEDGTGGWTPTFAGVSWEGGVTPVPSDTTAGAILRYIFETPDGGTTVIGLLSGPGPTGATGAGVPAGGTTGQVLAKIDATDYNTHWVDTTGFSSDLLPWTIDLDVFHTPITNTNWSTVTLDTSSGGAWLYRATKESSGAQNAVIGWDVVLAAGTWSIELIHRAWSDRGIYSLQFNGVQQGTIDGYAASDTPNSLSSVTGIVVATSAKTRFTLNMATKNASSTNYRGSIHHVRLWRTA